MASDQLRTIKSTVRNYILAMPEVSSISYDDERQVIIITIDSESNRSKVVSRLPSNLGGYNVEFEIMKKPMLMFDRLTEYRPIPGGTSISHEDSTAGTYAIAVYDRTGKRKILSNLHVLTPYLSIGNYGSIGDAISQPGMYDSHGVLMECGKLSDRVLPVGGQLYVDAALGSPTVQTEDFILGDDENVWDVREAVKAKKGLAVKKSGRTTEVTHGEIVSTMVDTKASGWNGEMLWQMLDQVRTDVPIAPGDSGSLLVTEDNKAVGLVWGGSEDGAIASPIGYVMDAFGIGFSYPIQDPPEVPAEILEGEAPPEIERVVLGALGLVGVAAAVWLSGGIPWAK